MYFFRKDTIIDVQEEKNLINEDEEIITYDDLNIANQTIINIPSSPMSINEPTPRPRLIIPKSPRLFDTDTDNTSIKLDTPRCATSPRIANTDEDTIPLIERKYVYYTVNSVLCGVLVYVMLLASGAIS